MNSADSEKESLESFAGPNFWIGISVWFEYVVINC